MTIPEGAGDETEYASFYSRAEGAGLP